MWLIDHSDSLCLYTWKGLDQRGQRCKGKQLAMSHEFVLNELKNRNIDVIKIRKVFFLFSIKLRPIQRAEIIFFTRQLSTLLMSGLTLIASLDILVKEEKGIPFKKLLLSIKMQVLSGISFHSALSIHPKQFNHMFICLVKAGEKTGKLNQVLLYLADYAEKIENIQQRIKGASYYPILVILISLIIGYGLITFIMPQFYSFFTSAGASLPWFTKLFLKGGQYGRHVFSFILISTTLTIITISQLKKNHTFKHALDVFLLKIPVVGKLCQNNIIAKITRTLTLILEAGISISDAFTNTAEVTKIGRAHV